MEERLERFIWHVERSNNNLITTAQDLNEEQLAWTPPQINNSIGWQLRHCAGEYWYSLGHLTGDRIPVNLNAFGFPPVEGGLQTKLKFEFDLEETGPGASAESHINYLNHAWETLKTFLVDNYDMWSTKTYIRSDDATGSGWWWLDHFLWDIANHSGQAKYLRKIIP